MKNMFLHSYSFIRIVFFFIILDLWGCSVKDERLDCALRLAGNNSVELRKVLQRYEYTDSEKYKAACFLIKNMPFHGSYTGDLLHNYLRYFETFSISTMLPTQVVDSLEKLYGRFDLNSLQYKSDIQTVDSAFLANHIDWAFKVWREQPWGKSVNFEDFCEYILPYRIGDEPLSTWREDVYHTYNPLLDSLRSTNDASDPLQAAQVLIEHFSRKKCRFTGVFPAGPNLGPVVLKLGVGSCREFADMLVYAMRSVGIPCGIDKMLQRPDDNASHFWNFTLDSEGNTFMSEFPFQHLWREAYKYPNVKGKVYRTTFGLNEQIANELEEIDNVYSTFRLPFMYDVTSFYTPTYSLSVPIHKLREVVPTNELLYLCFAHHQKWKPVDYALIKNDSISFKHIEGGVVGVIAKWNDFDFVPLTDPFLLERSTGKLHFFNPSDTLISANLYCKFYLAAQDYIYGRMCGGVIEGSNVSDFSKVDTLFQISETPKRLFTTVVLRSQNKYRFFRYKGGKESFCNIAELEFYRNVDDTIPFRGRVIGTPGCFTNDGTHEYINVFDGNTETSFDYKHPDQGWAGMDFGYPVEIRKVVYTPRNHVNFIYRDDVYELFYWNHNGWVSLGKKTARSDSLVYKVPANSLLYLKNHTHGKDERIFEYKNGKQFFW